MTDRRGFIRKCCEVLGSHRLVGLVMDIQPPPDDVLYACRSNRLRGLALVHEECARVLREAAERTPERRTVGHPNATPRRPAGCLY
jgi:hypothetical protein